MSNPMTTLLRGLAAAAVLALAPVSTLHAQWGEPPTDAECQEWTTGLAAGGAAALDVVTYGDLAACPAVAPQALAGAIRAARTVRDTAYLGGLAGVAAQVAGPTVFAAALEVAGDGRASNEARVMGMLVTVSSLGSSQTINGYTRDQLFSQALPDVGVCGFSPAGTGSGALDNPLPADARRQAARVIDGILYASGQPALVQNLARCARAAVGNGIAPQADVSKIRVDYVCGNTFRVQNHTGVEVTLSIATTAPGGAVETEDHVIPSKGGWTSLEAPTAGSITVTYDGAPVATVENTGRGCGGGA